MVTHFVIGIVHGKKLNNEHRSTEEIRKVVEAVLQASDAMRANHLTIREVVDIHTYDNN